MIDDLLLSTFGVNMIYAVTPSPWHEALQIPWQKPRSSVGDEWMAPVAETALPPASFFACRAYHRRPCDPRAVRNVGSGISAVYSIGTKGLSTIYIV